MCRSKPILLLPLILLGSSCDGFAPFWLKQQQYQKRHPQKPSFTPMVSASKDDGNESLDSFSERLQTLLHDDEKSVAKKDSKDDKIRQRQQRILSTRLSDLPLNRTYTAPSTISDAGVGLFARDNYSKGTLLTCYPGDALVIYLEDDEEEADVDDSDIGNDEILIWGDHVPQELQDEDALSSDYMLRAVYDEWGIIAMPDVLPVPDENPAYLGHFANDGITEPPENEADLATYVLESNEKANAMHKDVGECHMVTMATRDILKGEEIFVTYGPEFWMTQDSFDADAIDDFDMSESEQFDSLPTSNGKGFG